MQKFFKIWINNNFADIKFDCGGAKIDQIKVFAFDDHHVQIVKKSLS
jgi:hypothetical protein